MRVVWDPKVSDQIAARYVRLGLDEQRALAAALGQVASVLAVMPADVGEGRDGGLRVWIVRQVTYWY